MREPRVLDLGEMVEDDAPELRALVGGGIPEPAASAGPPSDEAAEVNDRHQQFLAHVAELSRVLSQDAAAVVRATRDGSLLDTDEDFKRLAERVRRDYGKGTFLLDRLGAQGLLDPMLSAVLLELRRDLVATYGSSSAATMLIDQAVVAYHSFLRVTGWTGNTALMVEAEFFGRDQPSAEFRDRYGKEGKHIRGLTVEQHIARLGEELLPLAERFGRIRSSRWRNCGPRRASRSTGQRRSPSPSRRCSSTEKIGTVRRSFRRRDEGALQSRSGWPETANSPDGA